MIILKVQAKANNHKCVSNDECNSAKNLLCKDGQCQCKEAVLYWNVKADSCGRFN